MKHLKFKYIIGVFDNNILIYLFYQLFEHSCGHISIDDKNPRKFNKYENNKNRVI